MSESLAKLIIIVLGAVSLIALIGCFAMALAGKQAPAEALGIASTSVGALAGALALNHKNGDSKNNEPDKPAIPTGSNEPDK